MTDRAGHETERARHRRNLPGPAAPGPSAPGSAAFVGRITTAAPAAGKYCKVRPVSVTGDETEGSGGSFVDTTSLDVPVYLLGSGTPHTNDYVVCRWVDYRWVAERSGPPPEPSIQCCESYPATIYAHCASPLTDPLVLDGFVPCDHPFASGFGSHFRFAFSSTLTYYPLARSIPGPATNLFSDGICYTNFAGYYSTEYRDSEVCHGTINVLGDDGFEEVAITFWARCYYWFSCVSGTTTGTGHPGQMLQGQVFQLVTRADTGLTQIATENSQQADAVWFTPRLRNTCSPFLMIDSAASPTNPYGFTVDDVGPP